MTWKENYAASDNEDYTKAVIGYSGLYIFRLAHNAFRFVSPLIHLMILKRMQVNKYVLKEQV
jgi:hypothetical protein